MSRHTSRKSRWIEISAKEHRSDFGAVMFRAGAWEGMVRYSVWQETPPEWIETELRLGRFKRPRNAMIAVEDKAREILRRHGERARVAIDD